MSFTLSSSSESEDDDDRPVSRIRNTEFFQQIYNGMYDTQLCEWPNELRCNCQFAGHAQANHSTAPPQVNGCANSSMADVSHQMNGSRILDSSAILNTTPEEEIVLIKVGDKYQRARVIANTELLQSAGTSEQRPVVSKMKNTNTTILTFNISRAHGQHSSVIVIACT